MGFTKGRTKRVRVMFRIRAKTTSLPARKQELQRFFADLAKLARKFRGSQSHSR